MDVTPSRVRRFSSAIGDDAIRFGDGIVIAPALDKEAGRSMSAYTSFFRAGARADLPASYAEIWVVLSGALRVGVGSDAVTVGAGDFVRARGALRRPGESQRLSSGPSAPRRQAYHPRHST